MNKLEYTKTIDNVIEVKDYLLWELITDDTMIDQLKITKLIKGQFRTIYKVVERDISYTKIFKILERVKLIDDDLFIELLKSI